MSEQAEWEEKRELKKRVLSLGLSLTPNGEGDSPVAGLDLLEAAPEHAANVTRALKGFHYEPHPDGKATENLDEYGQLIRRAVKDRDTDVLIVHIVGHGQLADGGSEKLYVLDHDGQTLDDPVSAWVSLIEDHPHQHRPTTLFVLDVCYAGEAAVNAWHAQMDVDRRRAWVLAATDPRSEAYAYRLSRALTQVLENYQDRSKRFDPSVRYIPPASVWQDIGRMINVMTEEDNGIRQRMISSLVPSHTDISHLPFFPNPSYGSWNDSTPLLQNATIQTEQEFDLAHFIVRAGGTGAIQGPQGEGYFCGRRDELEDLSEWLDDEDSETRVRVVTGKPGVGKSTLLGMLICAAHPELRKKTRNLWLTLENLVPGENEKIAVVHAHGLGIHQVTRSLIQQLGAMNSKPAPARGDKENSPDGIYPPSISSKVLPGPAILVLNAISSDNLPVTLIIDALDEAMNPEELNDSLLLPLAQYARNSRNNQIRILIGTRNEERFKDLINQSWLDNGLMDLDEAPGPPLREALKQLLLRLLNSEKSYAKSKMRVVRNTLAETISKQLVPEVEANVVDRTEAPEWGEFLIADLYMHHVLTAEEPCTTPEEARLLGGSVPRDLSSLLEMDLKRNDGSPFLRDILTALAFSKGKGMPEEVLLYAASTFSDSTKKNLTLKQLQTLLDKEARFYLRREVDEDGTTLYRIFQQGIADSLRAAAEHSHEREVH